MRRREFITLLGGATAAWPLSARAQQDERIRRVGVLISQGANDAVAQERYAAFLQGLQRSGWEVGRNVRIETRWSASSVDARKSAAELVALAPDVILATGSATTGPLLQVTRSAPIVFVHTPDPVGAGYVNSMSRPGGNATGFINFEYGIGAKWLELLKQVVPSLKRAAIVRDPAITAGIGMWGAIQAAAPSLGIEVIPVNFQEGSEMEHALAVFARSSNGGLIVTGSGLAVTNRDLIVSLSARHKLPAVYFERFFVTAGGLASYGADMVEQYRQAAGYVDRILRGEKPADLPVQAPTKYELVLNLKTANALGLEIPPVVLARGDEVIE
jgi:putative ABC transport system substrate-binding protein